MVSPPKAKKNTLKARTFVSLSNTKPLHNMYSRGVNVNNYKRRIRQIIVLVFTIIMGVLISQATQAEGQAVQHSTNCIFSAK